MIYVLLKEVGQSGAPELIEVPEGTTVRVMLTSYANKQNIDTKKVTVNGNPASLDTVLSDNDSVTLARATQNG